MSLIEISSDDTVAYTGDLVPATARLFASMDFRTSEGAYIAKGSATNPEFYQSFVASMSGTKIRVSSGSAYSTVDALINPNVLYSLVVYDADGVKIKTVFTGLKIPGSPSPTTWQDIQVYSAAKHKADAPTYLDSYTLLSMFNQLINMARKATTLLAGAVRISVDPVDLLEPIAVGDNDPRLSSQLYLASYASLAAAITAIGATPCELIIDTALNPVASNIATPSTMLLTFRSVGSILVSSGFTLTIGAMSEPGQRRVFFGDGDVILGMNASPGDIRLAWWAARGDGSSDGLGVDNTHAWNQMEASVNAQGESGKGGHRVDLGSGTWEISECNWPEGGILIGNGTNADAGAWGSPVFGTVLRLFDETKSYVLKLPTLFRFLEGRNFAITTGDAPAASCLLNTVIPGASVYFTASNLAFQSTYVPGAIGTGTPMVWWNSPGVTDHQSTSNLFKTCHFQVPPNGTGFHSTTANSSFTFENCQGQVGAGGILFNGEGSGQIVEVNTIAEGVNDYTDIAYVLDRTIASASVELASQDALAFGGSQPFALLTLNAATPAEDLLTRNDIFRRVEFAGFDHAIIQILSPTTAILGWKPAAPIVDQPCNIQTFTDCPHAAYAVRVADGNFVNWAVYGGADEGFNYSFIGGAGTTHTITFDNYIASGRVKLNEFLVMTSHSSHWVAYAFEDELFEQAIQVSFTGDNVISNNWFGNLFFAPVTGIWRKQRIANVTYSASYVPSFSGIMPTYDIVTGEFNFTTPQTMHNQLSVQADYGGGVGTDSIAAFELYTQGDHTDPAGTQKVLLKLGLKDFLTGAWVKFYTQLVNQVTNRLEINGSVTGLGNYNGIDMTGDIYASNFLGGTIYADEIAGGDANNWAGGAGPNAADMYEPRNVRVSFDTDYLGIGGFASTAPIRDGTEFIITNNGTNIGVLRHEDTGSAASVRLRTCTGQHLYLMPGCSALLQYNRGDADSVLRWNTSLRGTPKSPVFEGAARFNTVNVITPGATPEIDASLGNRFTLTPAQAETLSVVNLSVGQPLWIFVLTSGTNSYNLTFGTGFISQGVLATETVSGKAFVLHFMAFNGYMLEVSRTIAM